MDQLYPIIRRKRRPLSVPDGPRQENAEILKAETLKTETAPVVPTVPPVVELVAPVTKKSKAKHGKIPATTKTA